MSKLSVVRQLRRRVGMPKSNRQARVAPPAMYQGTPGRLGWASAALVAAVVEMVSVAVPAFVPGMTTGLVEPKLKVGRYCAPFGLEVMAAVSATVAAKPPLGVSVMVEVSPLVAPGATVTAVPVMARPGGAAAETLTYSELLPPA